MRIFLVLWPSGNSGLSNSMTWYNNIYEPLIDLGHEVFLFRLDEFAKKNKLSIRSKKYKELLSEVLYKTYKELSAVKSFDLFFSYLTINDIEEECIKLISKMGTPTANFSCNNTHQFHLVEKLAPYFSYNLYSEKNASYKFSLINANAVWFQMAANPKYYYPMNTKKIYDVSFLGANYARRPNYIHFLLSNNIDVQCFGPNWRIKQSFYKLRKIYKEITRIKKITKSLFQISSSERYISSSEINSYDLSKLLWKKFNNNMHWPIEDTSINQLFNQSTINLGFTEVFSENNLPGSIISTHLHLREFEVPMSGNFYITKYSEELEEFFEPGKEIEIYRDEFELLDKIIFYLKHKNLLNKISYRGYERAINDHTYQKRLNTLFKNLNLN